ncbi:golgin candidate 6 isoform X2 [Arachis hypogaea]|uniref:golgin candidate 6 isoform X2 n=1 Tax=Arachis hypogaea TaxID=3818 RepID=UPI003B2127B0
MDMLMDRELQVIRNEVLLLLTHLTREAGDIQKIVIFEGAFEKILSIIRGEGNSDGGVVVQIVDIGKTLPLFMELQTLGDRM